MGLPSPRSYDTAEGVDDDRRRPPRGRPPRLVRCDLRLDGAHHLDFLAPERTFALLRDGADIHAEATYPFGATPLSFAQAPGEAARPDIHRADLHGFAARAWHHAAHNALLVLEAAKPWSRETHEYFPTPARARVAELLRVEQLIRRGKTMYKADGVLVDYANPGFADVFKAFVIPHAVGRDYQPPSKAEARQAARAARARLEFLEALASRAAAAPAAIASLAASEAPGSGVWYRKPPDDDAPVARTGRRSRRR